MKNFFITLLFLSTIFAQDVVSIVTSGDGPTKDQATTAALRNAIEQAYGAFISSNTKFLNDELIQDEIVSLSQGTIKKYSIISSIQTKNGYNVTTKSTVSLGKLTSFVQSKGGSITVNGSSFYRNLLIEEFYEKNEHKAIEDFIDSRLKNVQVWDFKLFSNEPYRDSGRIAFDAKVGIKPNNNMHTFFEDLEKLLKSIALDKQAVNFRKNSNLNVFRIRIFTDNIASKLFKRNPIMSIDVPYKSKTYKLRSQASFQIIRDLETELLIEAASYKLKAKLTNGSSSYIDDGASIYNGGRGMVVNNWNMIYREEYGCSWLENLGGDDTSQLNALRPGSNSSNTILINPFKLYPQFSGTCYSSRRDPDINNKYIGKYVFIVEKKVILNNDVIRNLNEIYIEAL